MSNQDVIYNRLGTLYPQLNSSHSQMKVYLFALFLLSILYSIYAQRACIGVDHSCRIREDGNVTCVGGNDYGQLGIRNHDPVHITPGEKVVYLPGRVKEIHCGVYFTAALLEDGRVYAWGVNVYGQIGIGFQGFDVDYPEVSIKVPPVSTMCCGDAHCLVLAQSYLDKDIFKVYGWGLNNYGQLGIGNTNIIGRFSTDFPLTPACIPEYIFLSSETILRCGANIGGIITRDYNYNTSDYVAYVYSWGDNRAGQLGSGDIASPNDLICDSPGETAVLMILEDSVVDLGYGYNHSVVLLADNTIRSSGDNQFGQLGYPGIEEVGQSIGSLPAPPIDTGFPIESMGSYRYHTCFSELMSTTLTNTKRVACYGLNIAYQLGLNNTIDNIGYDVGSMPPVSFLLPQNFTFISGCIPYLNSFGYIPVRHDQHTLPLYVGWGLDNYTLQAQNLVTVAMTNSLPVYGGQIDDDVLLSPSDMYSEYVINPQILDTECGDKFVDRQAGEDCDTDNGGALDGNRCTARCYGSNCQIFGSFIPFSKEPMPYNDMFGCRKPNNYNCTQLSPVGESAYCFDQDKWLIYSSSLMGLDIIPLWVAYEPDMSNTLYIEGDFIVTNKKIIELLKGSNVINNINLTIYVSGLVSIDASWSLSSMRSGKITIITLTPPMTIEKKQTFNYDETRSKIRTQQININTWQIQLTKFKDTSDIVIGTILGILGLLIIISVMVGFVYVTKLKRRGYHPIGDSSDSIQDKEVNKDKEETTSY